MKAEIKVAGSISEVGNPYLIVRLRTEFEMLLTPDSINKITQVVSVLKDRQELISVDEARFAWELAEVLDLYKEFAESPARALPRLESEWKPINGFFTLDTLKTINDSTKDLKSLRVEGSAEAGLYLVLQGGINVTRIYADRANLLKIKGELDSSAQLPEVKASLAVAEWIVAAALVVEAALGIWDRYDKEREKQREKDEQERRKLENERKEKEQHCREPRQTSEGGPAADGVFDRISRTA